MVFIDIVQADEKICMFGSVFLKLQSQMVARCFTLKPYRISGGINQSGNIQETKNIIF